MFVGPGDGRKVHAHGEERKLGNDDDLAVLYKQRGLQRRNDNTSVATAYFPPKQKIASHQLLPPFGRISVNKDILLRVPSRLVDIMGHQFHGGFRRLVNRSDLVFRYNVPNAERGRNWRLANGHGLLNF